MTFLEALDITGTIAFAISGALAAYDKRLDSFGIVIIAFVTAAGGGTLRDILLGIGPVSWLLDINLIYTVLACVLVVFFLRRSLLRLRRTLFLFDAIGLGIYTVVGVTMGIQYNLNIIMCVTLGTITACFGGVIRDILCAEIPVIFRKNIYATACIAGGFLYFLTTAIGFDRSVASFVTIIAVSLTRICAVYFKLQLPSPYHRWLDNDLED